MLSWQPSYIAKYLVNIYRNHAATTTKTKKKFKKKQIYCFNKKKFDNQSHKVIRFYRLTDQPKQERQAQWVT